jgi:hypothetical protein
MNISVTPAFRIPSALFASVSEAARLIHSQAFWRVLAEKIMTAAAKNCHFSRSYVLQNLGVLAAQKNRVRRQQIPLFVKG